MMRPNIIDYRCYIISCIIEGKENRFFFYHLNYRKSQLISILKDEYSANTVTTELQMLVKVE